MIDLDAMGYVKPGDILVIPRKVSYTEKKQEPPKDIESPHHGARWIGWITIADLVGDMRFALWQDYKRRGFWTWREGDKKHRTWSCTLEELPGVLEDWVTMEHIASSS